MVQKQMMKLDAFFFLEYFQSYYGIPTTCVWELDWMCDFSK